MTFRKRPAGMASGSWHGWLAGAVAVLLLLAAAGPRPPFGLEAGRAPAGAAIAGDDGPLAPAVAPDPCPDDLILRTIVRAPRTEAPRAPDGLPPQAPPVRPTVEATEPPAPGARPLLPRADRDSFHLRLIGSTRTPTGPPVRPI